MVQDLRLAPSTTIRQASCGATVHGEIIELTIGQTVDMYLDGNTRTAGVYLTPGLNETRFVRHDQISVAVQRGPFTRTFDTSIRNEKSVLHVGSIVTVIVP